MGTNPSFRAKIRPARTLVALGLTAALLALILKWPLDDHVSAQLVLKPADAQRVYVQTPGTLENAMPAGAVVAKGEVLATLENLELASEVVALETLIEQQHRRFEFLKIRAIEDDSTAGRELAAAHEVVAASHASLSVLREQMDRLIVRAPCAGSMIPAPKLPLPSEGSQLAWSASLLDPTNRGCFLEAGTQLCTIGDPRRLTAVLTVEEAEIQRLQSGQSVRLMFAATGNTELKGRVTRIAATEIESNEEDSSRPHAAYQARVELDQQAFGLLPGMRGEARIVVGQRSLGSRMLRYLRQTFRFPWQ